MGDKLNNTKGLTLIEVLASIVLLSIVIVSFMSLFPQMTLMNNKTEENLQSANVGKELQVELRSYKYEQFESSVEQLISATQKVEKEPVTNKNIKVYKGQYKNSDIVVTLYTDSIVSGDIQSLYEFRIEVKDGDKISTTIYGYTKIDK